MSKKKKKKISNWSKALLVLTLITISIFIGVIVGVYSNEIFGI